MPKDFFYSFSVTTAAVPGALSAIASGIASGLGQSATAAQKASGVLSEHTGQRDSLLRSLNALFEDQPKLDHSALETYMDDLKDGLIATNDAFAFIIKNILLILYSGVGHIPQIPIDIATIVTQTGAGLARLEIPSDAVKKAIVKASTFDVKVADSSASASSVTDEVSKQGGDVLDKVHHDIHIADNSHAATHAKTAVTAAGGTVGTTAALPTATALLTDTVGQVLKESAAIGHFSADESASEANKKNVYHASSGVAKATQDSDSRASKIKSHDLEAALSDLKPVAQLLSKQGVTSPLTTALLRLLVLSLFVESSRGINKTAIATIDGRIQKALADATAQGPSAGVDRINSLHSNLSSLSNIMRLCAENLGGSPAVKTAAQSSEVVSSRSMSVLLTNVSELAAALRQLVSPQQADAADRSALSKAFDSPVDSANPQILARSEETIKAVLDRIERENGQHIIPGLNDDMASQLDSSARLGLASLLSTHSIFSNPSMLATKGAKAASKTEEAQKNAALMETLPGLTQALNRIQASTRNFMAEMEQAMGSGVWKDDGSLLSTHRSTGSSTATAFWAASAVLLLCDEMLSICRSLTLIDQERLKAASQKASDVPSKDESAQAAEQISWDSHSDQTDSATHAVTALRLTLSHTGIALMRIALELHKALEGQMDTLQRDVAMHSLQKSLLTCTAYASRYLAEGLLSSSGAVSAFPVSLLGSVNWSHQQVHTTDAELHPVQTHESEKSSKDSCESSEATGFSTDVVAGTVINVLKVLAQGGLIGLDTSLRLINVLEIISLHRDSHIALRLETNDSSNPNGLLKNILVEPSVASSAGTGAIFINMLAALQTSDRCSGTKSTLSAQDKLKDVVDQQIESLGMLKDEEELRAGKKGLKEFYKIILQLIVPDEDQSAYNSLVKRLDFGGIALSNYHSLFGAYGDRQVDDVRFVQAFANDDDAQGILRKFMDRAKENFSLIKSLNDALPVAQRSKKAQTLYDHVFEEVFQQYKQVKMSDVAQHSATKRKIPTRRSFQIDIGLEQEEQILGINDDPAAALGPRV